MNTRTLLTMLLLFVAMMLGMQLCSKNSAAPTVAAANPAYAVAASQPKAEDGAKAQTIILGDASKASKDKFAVTINNQTAGVDLVQLNVNDYSERPDKKAPYTLLKSELDLPKPFSTLGLHVKVGDAASELNFPGFPEADSSVIYNSQFIWQIDKHTATELNLIMNIQDQGKPLLQITKTFTIDPLSYNMTVSHTVKNLSDQKVSIAIDMLGPTEVLRDNIQADDRTYQTAYLDKRDGSIDQLPAFDHRLLQGLRYAHDIGSFDDFSDSPCLWTSASNRFFTAIIRPLPESLTPQTVKIKTGAINEPTHLASASIDVISHSATDPLATSGAIRLNGAPVSVDPHGTVTLPFTVYLGPKVRSLEGNPNAAPASNEYNYYLFGYDQIIQFNSGGPCSFLSFPWLAKLILQLLDFFAHYVTFGNYGVAIIILVIIIRACLHPLTRASQMNMAKMSKKMKDIQPKIEAIKKRYADKENKSKQTAETMAVYRENNVNPAGGILGCLPMFLQTPIWIALYVGLRGDIDLRQAVFIPGWINDLSNPDKILPLGYSVIGHPLFTLPILGEVYGLNLLPILLGAVFFIQMKVQRASQPAPADEQQAQMAKISSYMIFIFPLFLYGAPSGLNLYYFASTMGGLVDTYFIRKSLKKHGILPANAKILPTQESSPGTK